MILPKTITLHQHDKRSINVRVAEIKEIISIKHHASFSEIKSQIILKSPPSKDSWIYVTESSEEINKLIAEAGAK